MRVVRESLLAATLVTTAVLVACSGGGAVTGHKDVIASAATTTQSPGDELTNTHSRPHNIIIVAAGALRPHRGPSRLLTASVSRPPRSIPTHPARRIPVWMVPRRPIPTIAARATRDSHTSHACAMPAQWSASPILSTRRAPDVPNADFGTNRG